MHAETSKLRWRCRRGVKELDVIFCRYLENEYPSSTPENQQAFKKLLELEDPLLLTLLFDNNEHKDIPLQQLINHLKKRR